MNHVVDLPSALAAAQSWLDGGKVDQAVALLEQAAKVAPTSPLVHLRLCIARHRQGDPYGAIAAGRRAVELDPDTAEAWANLALPLAAIKKHDEAIQAAARAVSLRPGTPEAHLNLGYVHERIGHAAEAEAAYRRASELRPGWNLPYRNLAALYDGQGRLDESIRLLRRSLQIQPHDVEGWNNLSTLCRRNNDARAALEAAERALRLQPNHPSAHGSRGLALLALGQYGPGFAEYEWRWRCDNFTTAPRDFGRPLWDGADPAGRTILVHSEQGFGDTIQFARYLSLLADRGATVVFECSLPLKALMGRVRGVSSVIATGMRLRDFDMHVPLLSLPRIFATTVETVPRQVPYLQVDPERLDRWRQRINAPGFRVGLVWSGNAKPDPARTCPPDRLAPLRDIPGLSFFSLQRKEGMAEAFAPLPLPAVDLAAEVRDFADTAGAMMNLDLIITIDTAAAHLAGALGRPTFTLLPWAADWRWLLDRDDSPWYPTMRLLRQPSPGDWGGVIARVREALLAIQAGS